MEHFNFECYRWYCDITGFKMSKYESLKSFRSLCEAIDNMEKLGGIV